MGGTVEDDTGLTGFGLVVMGDVVEVGVVDGSDVVISRIIYCDFSCR